LSLGTGILRNNMREKIILITGSNGEIGQELIKKISTISEMKIVALDLHPPVDEISDLLYEHVIGNILDKNLLEQIGSTYEIYEIYHLAALLSTRAEFAPHIAHEVNVTGTLNMLTLAVDQAKSQGKAIKFFFPSSIAIYGLDNEDIKHSAGAITEQEYCNPITMYGCNKLYCEKLGIYYSTHFHQLSEDYQNNLIDFRSIRFSGLISNITEPQGGTSDYIPQMLHAAARGETYQCFVNKNTRMPFMTMEDAINSVAQLMNANNSAIISRIYHLSTFSPTPEEFANTLKYYFPNFQIEYVINHKRQQMVDSWPLDLNCDKAKKEWNWQPQHNLETAFSEYLIPGVKKHYNI